jgi:hypothetical protein
MPLSPPLLLLWDITGQVISPPHRFPIAVGIICLDWIPWPFPGCNPKRQKQIASFILILRKNIKAKPTSM